jgi:hypothetical protein
MRAGVQPRARPRRTRRPESRGPPYRCRKARSDRAACRVPEGGVDRRRERCQSHSSPWASIHCARPSPLLPRAGRCPARFCTRPRAGRGRARMIHAERPALRISVAPRGDPADGQCRLALEPETPRQHCASRRRAPRAIDVTCAATARPTGALSADSYVRLGFMTCAAWHVDRTHPFESTATGECRSSHRPWGARAQAARAAPCVAGAIVFYYITKPAGQVVGHPPLRESTHAGRGGPSGAARAAPGGKEEDT